MNSDHSTAAHAALDAEYEILRELGRGGTALVYLARERATGEEVAIKLIRSRYIEDDEAQARFAREARLVAQLHHPNIVPVRAVLDLHTSGLAIVMAHVAGRTLKQRIKQDGPYSPEAAEQILRDIGGALESAHAMGIVHRDVKPENIFVDDDGRALLADFGLARSMTPDTALTMAGVALGTPAYMAPEQIDGGDLDARVDVYSLGLVAWEMLIGRRAWNGEGLYAILYHQKHELPPDVRELRDDVPDRLAEVIARAIEKTRDARWGSMQDMLGALDESTPLALSPRRVGGGNETMRFVRPTPTMTPMPMPTVAPMPMPTYEPQRATRGAWPIAMPARPIATVARVLSVLSLIFVVAIVTALVRGRFSNATPAAPEPTMQPMLAGDVAKSVTIQAPLQTSPAPRTDTIHVPAASAPPASVATATPKPATPVDSAPRPPVTLPVLNARSLPGVNAAAAERIAANIPTTNTAPPGLPALTPRLSIVAGGMHSCLVGTDGRALCWGSNDHGQLGDVSARRGTTPFAFDVGTPFVAISAGASHTCAIARDGAAWCWGDNTRGQSGDRSLGPRLAPSRVADAHAFRAIATGAAHTCALDDFGVAWCWGSNARGQLGDATVSESAVPIAAGMGSGRFVNIAAGTSFTCALAGSGRVSCWGENSAGQLGDGSTFDRPLPVTVASGSFTSITAGSTHACGVTTLGEAYCWGRNANGELGDGTNFDRSTPVRVRGNARFTSITAGASHTCAVADDGNAYCWGQNTYGQLGTGSAADVSQPSNVADAHVFASVRAFGSHTCGLTVRGEALCWGFNAENQLGDGTQTHRARPVRVETTGSR